MRVLICFATEHGSTREIAERIAGRLRGSDLSVDVQSLSGREEDRAHVTGYAACVVGSAVHDGAWLVPAAASVRDHDVDPAARPVRLFSSGPVDSSAEQHGIPPVRAVAQQMERLGTREHVTFGDSITPHTSGLIARVLVRSGKGGDLRNPERIGTCAHHISAELAASHRAARQGQYRPEAPHVRGSLGGRPAASAARSPLE